MSLPLANTRSMSANKELLLPAPLAPPLASLFSPMAAPLGDSLLCHIETGETLESQVLSAIMLPDAMRVSKDILAPTPSPVAAVAAPALRFECLVEKSEFKEVLLPAPLAPPLAPLLSSLAAPMGDISHCHIETVETLGSQVLAALELPVEMSVSKDIQAPAPLPAVGAFRFPKSGWMVPQCSRCRRRIHGNPSAVHCRGAVMTPVWYTPPSDWVSR